MLRAKSVPERELLPVKPALIQLTYKANIASLPTTALKSKRVHPIGLLLVSRASPGGFGQCARTEIATEISDSVGWISILFWHPAQYIKIVVLQPVLEAAPLNHVTTPNSWSGTRGLHQIVNLRGLKLPVFVLMPPFP